MAVGFYWYCLHTPLSQDNVQMKVFLDSFPRGEPLLVLTKKEETLCSNSM